MNALLMPFLYFPEDKSEYIPAAISLFILHDSFSIYFHVDSTQFEETRIRNKELEERILRERREAKEKQHPQN